MTYRILVTGSRDWPYPEVVFRELARAAQGTSEPIVVVEGACHLGGADQYANTWAEDEAFRGNDVSPERHPADWAKHGKQAGFVRNREMVDAGADLCIAFRLNGSLGATDCLERAKQAGIPYRLVDLTLDQGP